MNKIVLRDRVMLAAEVSDLTNDFTPEVNRFVRLLLALLDLAPIAPMIERPNGRHIKSVAELPAITEINQWTG